MGTPNKKKWKTMLAICRSLKKGASYFAACKAADIADGTLWRWRKESPRFDRLIQEIWDLRVHHVEDAHYKLALNGNFQAQQYFLNNRARSRWKKDPEVIVNNNNNTLSPSTFPDMKVIFVESKENIPAIDEVKQIEHDG